MIYGRTEPSLGIHRHPERAAQNASLLVLFEYLPTPYQEMRKLGDVQRLSKTYDGCKDSSDAVGVIRGHVLRGLLGGGLQDRGCRERDMGSCSCWCRPNAGSDRAAELPGVPRAPSSPINRITVAA